MYWDGEGCDIYGAGLLMPRETIICYYAILPRLRGFLLTVQAQPWGINIIVLQRAYDALELIIILSSMAYFNEAWSC